MRHPAALVTMAIFLVACTAKPELSLSIEAKNAAGLNRLPGAIGISIQHGGTTKRASLRGGELREVADLPNTRETATARIAPYGATQFLSDTLEYYVRGPYALSPDEALVAASVELKGARAAWSTGYVIAETRTRKLRTLARERDSYGVAALAWSPDSKYLALIRKEQVATGHSPFEILSAVAGHPAQYMVCWLEVVDDTGALIAKTRLTDPPVVGLYSEIVWTK